MDPSGPPLDISPQTPFTTAERIQQLSEIDADIIALIEHASSAIRSIGNTTAPTTSDDLAVDTPSSEEAAALALASFNEAQSAFINTLDRIDKHLKRNIYALEEAGIITLRSDGQAGGDGLGANPGASGSVDASGSGRAKEVVARLEPDGVGKIGGLDVGQLNMARSAVERDLEKELWERARQVAAGREDDDKMEG